MNLIPSQIGRLAAAWAAVVVLSSEGSAATFRFASTSNRIYIENGGSATLSDIKAALPNAPLDLVDPANGVWLLRANLMVVDGSILVLHGPAIGGDVAEFRLLSNNSSATNSFVSVTADYGSIDIRSTKITSWDMAAGGPDTEFQTFGRAFVRVRSRLAADGVTAQESRMDIIDSDISFLGYDASESYGLAWKVSGVHPDPTKSIFDFVNVYGDVKNSRLHDSFWGIYTFGAFGSQWINNEVDHNAGYGFDPHDDSDNLLIEGNNVHHNGLIGRGHHGIIASRRCDHIVIRNNRSWANGGNGIMLHRHCDDGLVENNETFQNGDSGIAIFDVDRATIRNNLVISNFNAGMRFSVGAADNVIEQNEVGYSGKYGFYLYAGDDPAEPDDTDPTVTARPRRNTFSNNLVHHSTGDSVHLGDADDNTFNANSFSPGATTLGFENATNSILVGNTLPANALVRLNGASTNPTTMTLKAQPVVQLQIDSFSTALFEDDAGGIFDSDQGDLASTVDTAGSFLSVTLAALGAQTTTVTTTVVTRNFRVAPESGTVLINPTRWNLSGGLEKEWTTEPVDSGTSGGPTPAAASVTAAIHYVVGDLSPNTSYMISKNGQFLAAVTSDSGGHVSFADVPGTTGTIQYAVALNTLPPPPSVTVAASDANASETGPDTGAFTLTRSGATTAALTVHYTLSGTATNGIDYNSLSGSLTIPAGAASATVTVTPIDDLAVEGNETVILTLAADAAYTVGSPNNASLTIADNDQAPPPLPTMTVAASDANASETGPDTGAFTLTRSGATTTALTVHYTLSGTATNGIDYTSLSGSLTIPAGAASATVTVTPIDDLAVEGNETVILTLAADAAYTVGSPNNASLTIADNDQAPPSLPTVTVAASDANASETGPDTGAFTLTRSGATTAALTVHYTLSGTATNGIDYTSLSGSLTIPAGAASATVTVTPIDDSAVEGNETVILTLAADAAYTVGSPNNASLTIADNDQAPPPLPTVTVAASDTSASEAGPNNGSFTLSRSGDTSAALIVHYTLSGTAANGTDYTSLSGSLTIPAGAASAVVTVAPIDDSTVEGNETVVLTLSADAAYTIGSPNNATLTIADNDQAPPPLSTVTVAATDATASEAGPNSGSFTLSRSGDTSAALIVHYTLSGTAANGTDYTSLSGSLTIPAGAASAVVTVTPIDDSTVEGNETVVLTLSADAAYTIGSPNNATLTIADNDQAPPPLPTVTVVATDSNASEHGPDSGTFVISRTGSTANSLTVFYTTSGTAVNGTDYQSLPGSVTLPAASASVLVFVRPIDDRLEEGNETVILTLSANPAYIVGSANSAVVTIADNDQHSTVTVVASETNASEVGLKPGIFTISRDGSTTNALRVNYTLGGTAANGKDYQALTGSVILPIGAASANVMVSPIDNTTAEGDRTVVLSISTSADYDVGSSNTATVTIADNDQPPPVKPVVSVTASDAVSSERGTDTATVIVSRSGSQSAPLTVRYTLVGTALNGADYQTLSGSVTIPAGAGSASIVVQPINDSLVEVPELVVITLAPDNAYALGLLATATVTITDNDLPLLGNGLSTGAP